jgi:hypothetical protein
MRTQAPHAFFLALTAVVAGAWWVGLDSRVGNLLAKAPVPVKTPKPKLAYIYTGDNNSADSFKKLLEEAGFSFAPIRLESVEKTDFSSCAAILIGPDTAAAWGGARPAGRAKQAVRDAIDRAKKPILGLGEGGYSFFGGLGLAIGAGHGWHGRDTSVVPVEPSKSPFWSSSKVAAEDGKPIKVYEKTGHVGIFLPKPPNEVLLIGREERNTTHYPLVHQGPRYVLWGFQAPPDQMTPIGRQLFIAACRYTSALDKSPRPEKSSDK